MTGRTTRLSAGIVAVVAAVAAVAAVTAPLAALSGPASAATPGPNSPEQVQSGIQVASVPGATAFGSTPSDTPETVSFILRERGMTALEAAAQRGIQHYLSVGQFAGRYGQSPAHISDLTGYLAHYGITTTVYPDDVDVVANGTAGEFDSALSVTQKQYHVPAQRGRGALGGRPAQTVHGNVGAPLLPYRLSNFVLAVLGLSNYSPYVDQVVQPTVKLLKPQAGSSNYCLAKFGLPNACHLPSDFARMYDLNRLYHDGATGTGQTVGIVTLAAVDSGGPQYFWKHVAHIARTGGFTVDNIDGGPGAPSAAAGTDETDLDIEQSGALAPGADVVDYQAPNTDSGFADAFFTAASQNTASDVSASWGESETALRSLILSGQETSGYTQAFDEAFLEMAAQGQSGFVASGDAGAYDASADLGSTNLSVDVSGDSPYITAAGGTTLPWSGPLTGPDGSATVTVKSQRIWGWDYLWQAVATTTGVSLANAAETDVVGSGGGFSQIEPTPAYQQGVSGTQSFHAVKYLTPADYTSAAPGLSVPSAWTFTATPAVTQGQAQGRAVPDVSADADPESGYLIYAPSVASAGDPALDIAGGTSFVAPQLNGATAVIDSYLGHRVGFWNPSIYAAAASGHNPFTQLSGASTSNDNIYFTANPGQRYNPGVGLGVPDLAELAGDFTR